jgi:hypothetical protein
MHSTIDPAEMAVEADPLLLFVPHEEAPLAFWLMPARMRSHRGRLHLICRCAGTDPIVSWMLTMDVSPEGDAFAEDILANNAAAAARDGQKPDERILEMLRVDGGWVADN